MRDNKKAMIEKTLTVLQLYGLPMKIGGHFRSGLAMAKGLIERGHRVIVIAPGAVLEMVESFERAGARLILDPSIGVANKLFPSLSGWLTIVDIARRYNVDIIHAMDFQTIGSGYCAAIRTGKSFVCTESGADSISHFPPRKAKVIIFSKEQMNIYHNIYRLPKNNIKIIPARIDDSYYYPESVKQEFVDHFNLSRQGISIGIVSRLVTTKVHKIRALIQFAKNRNDPNKEINIYIVGDGDCREALQVEADKCRNPSVIIHFLGPMYDICDVNKFFNFCDIIIGSGRGIMEAMACRKAVIIPGPKGQAELIGPDNIEQIAYYNFSGRHFDMEMRASSLEDVLEKVCTNQALLAQHAQFCYDYVQNHLAAHIGVEQLVDCYEREDEISTMKDFAIWYTKAELWIIKAILRVRAQRLKNVLAKAYMKLTAK